MLPQGVVKVNDFLLCWSSAYGLLDFPGTTIDGALGC